MKACSAAYLAERDQQLERATARIYGNQMRWCPDRSPAIGRTPPSTDQQSCLPEPDRDTGLLSECQNIECSNFPKQLQTCMTFSR